MSTQAQVSANQANAQKSTGPTSEAGKAASSQNHRIHGLSYIGGYFQVLLCESYRDYGNLLEELMEEYAPQTPSESLLIHGMAQSQWLRDRALRLQENCFDQNNGALIYEKRFALYLRYHAMHQRAFFKYREELLKQRKERQNLQIGFDREKRAQQLHPSNVARKELELYHRQKRIGEHKFEAAQPQAAQKVEMQPPKAQEAA